ncbi:uncharacterized protein LOC118734827 [Rhagoletis pomonella]|uniref:uncharacterized protein LOC118734827 n=1 Tax=Rhagoletis pomonella TaxID=28610 RepID=UPI0017811E9D|nr:uncharacterized protein LOC118734827 [Rhagoletis pomonella]
MDVAERFEHVKRLGLCINCMSNKHQLARYSSTHNYKVCGKKHHSLLHRVTTTITSKNDFTGTDTTTATHTHMEKSPKDQVIRATALVLVKDASGSYQRLRLRRQRQSVEILSIGNVQASTSYKTVTTTKSQHTNSEWNLPANSKLADEQFFRTSRIDLLIRAEVLFDILPVGQIKLGDDMPVVQKTLLGWIVTGKYKERPSKHVLSSPRTCLLSMEEVLNENLEKLWKMYEVERHASKWSNENAYISTVRRNADGRIVVRLPLKDDSSRLGLSHATALKRFIAPERRLRHQPDLKLQYVSFMREYESLGHMSVVKNPNYNAPHYYISHHCILKPSSTTTKLRVVFDASCQTTSLKSLNDLMFVGLSMQTDSDRHALTADIIKIGQDRCLQYIVWRNSEEEEIRTYELNTVTYGTAVAPYLAIRSLNFIADDYAYEFPVGAKVVKSSFYVDDLICGSDSFAELKQIQFEVSQVLEKGCFELAKWHSNCATFRDDSTLKNLSFDETAVTNALGITWDQSNETFLFAFQPKNKSTKVTKRMVLSIASSLFDPLGLLTPIIVIAKIILQEIWLLKLDWDESLPQNLHLARAPHFGGLWEAAVKSAKEHLYRTLMNTRLTYEELTTVLIEIEAILNSRPIAPISSDPSNFEALSPGHLLIGCSLKSLPEQPSIGVEINQIEQWRRITVIKERFWRRWSLDYINELQTRVK